MTDNDPQNHVPSPDPIDYCTCDDSHVCRYCDDKMFDAEIHLHDVIDRSGVKVDLDEYLKVHAVVIQLMDEKLLVPPTEPEEHVETCWICDSELVQQGGSVGESSWLCNNPKCMKAYQGIVTPF